MNFGRHFTALLIGAGREAYPQKHTRMQKKAAQGYPLRRRWISSER
jgi:hypothetical protein